MSKELKICVISDTHRQHHKLNVPDGDILLYCGDAELDSLAALKEFNTWLGGLNFRYRVVIGGNHDFFTFNTPKEELDTYFTNAIYLENSSVVLEGIHIWGSPYSPIFNDWAWMLNSKELAKIWDKIPEDTDILLTHTPPFGILADTPFSKFTLGCPTLLQKVEQIKPKFHCFGHIHNGSGEIIKKDTHFINGSVLNDWYQLRYTPKVFYYER